MTNFKSFKPILEAVKTQARIDAQAGKTTLTNMLAKHYGWEAHLEDVELNP